MDDLQQSIEALNQSIKMLGDRLDAQDAEIDAIKENDASQHTQLKAVDTALAALKASRENKQAVKSLAEDLKDTRDTTQVAASRIMALERLTSTGLRTLKAFIIAVGGYLLLQKSIDLWATVSLFDDKLADWLSMSAIACFLWAGVVISDKEQAFLDIVELLPFFRK